jgi:hypothetical protein
MHQNRRRSANALVAFASAAAAFGIVKASYGDTYTERPSVAGAAETTSFFISSGGGFFQFGDTAAKFQGYGVMDVPTNLSPSIPSGQQISSVGADLTISMYYDLFGNTNSHNPPNPSTLNFYLATDTSTALTGGPLRWESPSDIPGGLNNPGGTGSFAAGTQLYPLGSGIYPGNTTADKTLLTFSLANAFSNPAAATYVQNQLNAGANLRFVITDADNQGGTAEFYGPTTTSTLANGTSLKPLLSFDLTTSLIAQNSSLLYVTSNGNKSANVTLGQQISINGTPTYTVLKGSTVTAPVTLLNNGAVVGGDATVNASLYKITNISKGNASTPGTNPLNAQASTTATVGMSGGDTNVAAGSNISMSVQFQNQSNSSDTPNVTVTSNTVHVVELRFVNTGDSGVGASALGAPSVGKVLVGATVSQSVPIGTTNTDTSGDFSENKLTDLNLLGNAQAQNFNVTDPVSHATVAVIGANTNSMSNQLFNDDHLGSVNAVVHPVVSGTYGDAHTLTIGTSTITFGASFADFVNTATSTTIIGSGLTGEVDDARSYVQWQGYQVAAVSGNTGAILLPGQNATLSNATSNDNIVTSGTVSVNQGLRANAYVSSITFNQGGWGQSGFTPVTLNPDGTAASGTVLTANATNSSATLSFDPTNKINGTYGASMTVGLENEQDVQGTAANDVAPQVFSLQATVNSNPPVQSGNYTLDGGTLTAPATNLTGNFTQTGGTSTFAGITGSGTVSVTGGTLQLTPSSGLTAVSSLSVSGNGSLDIGNNHIIINYGSGPDPVASIAADLAQGYNGGAWSGAGGIFSSAVATNPGYAVGYADSADPGNPAGLASGTMEIAFTLLGDANLDDAVNGVDFGILAANFNKGVSGWDKGDFNYDAAVNGVDFGALAANFNKGASAASGGATAADWQALDEFAAANGLLADVPEPASMGLLAAGAAGLLARRRKRS